jgi:hypothetical protein
MRSLGDNLMKKITLLDTINTFHLTLIASNGSVLFRLSVEIELEIQRSLAKPTLAEHSTFAHYALGFLPFKLFPCIKPFLLC